MRSPAVPAALLGLLAILAAAPATPLPPQPDLVTVMFELMRAGKSAGDGIGFPKLDWSDLPALIARGDSTHELKSFPTNPISSFHIPARNEGVVALWLAEGVRKGGKYASLNPRVMPEGDTPKERADNQKAVAKAYRDWWAKAKTLPPEKARDIDPLAGTGFAWR